MTVPSVRDFRRGALRSALLLVTLVALGVSGQPSLGTTTLAAGTVDESHGYHRDAAHSGYDPATPAAGAMSVAWKARLDGRVYAATITAGGLAFAATENNTVYGLHLSTGTVAWARHLGQAVPGSMLPCGNISPLGITGTPAFDTFTHQVFVVTTTPNGSTIRHTLVGLDATTGAVKTRQVVDPPGQSPLVENQRGALALSRGRVLVPFGGHAGDCGAYHGWLVSAPVTGRGNITAFRAGSSGQAGMWQPAGPSVDPAGNVYVVTGNGAATSGSWDGSNAVLKLDPVSLRLLAWFATSDWPQANANDADLGSSGAALVGSRIWIEGKTSRGYLLDQGNLGGVGHYVATTTSACASQFGGAAVHGNTVYAPCTNGLRQITITSGGGIQPGWRAPAGVTGSPVVGGNEVWALDVGAGVLYALAERTGAVHGSVTVGAVTRFATPTLSGTLALVPTTTGVTAVRGA